MKKYIVFTGVLFLCAHISYSQGFKKFLNSAVGGEKVMLSQPFEGQCHSSKKEVEKGRLDITDEKITFNFKVESCSPNAVFEKLDYDLGEGVKVYRTDGRYIGGPALLIGTDPNNMVWGVYKIDEEGMSRDDDKDFKSISFQYVIAPEGKTGDYDLSVNDQYKAIVEENYMKLHSVTFEKTDFEDEHGISGKYYLSQPLTYFEGSSKRKMKVSDVLYFEYDPASYKLNVHYGDGELSEGGTREMYRKGADDKQVYTWGFGYNSEIRCDFIDNQSILYLQEGLFIASPSWHIKNSRIYSKEEGGDKTLLIGRDQELIKELVQDTAKLRAMIVESAEKLMYYRDLHMKKPLPPEGIKDESLKAQAESAARARAALYKWKDEILYAYIESNDWTVRTNAAGVPTLRLLGCVVVTKNSVNGKCSWLRYDIAQDYQGNNSYGKTYAYSNSQWEYPVDCSESMKYK